jgi:hypothetical protein
MNKVISKAKQYEDCVAKEAAEAALNEYRSTGKIIMVDGMNSALYEIIMNYGGLFDGMFAKRILKGKFNRSAGPRVINIREKYGLQRKIRQVATAIRHMQMSS